MRVLCALLTLVTVAACGDSKSSDPKGETTGGPTGETTGETTDDPKKSEPAKEPIKPAAIDAELMASFKKIAEVCKVDVSGTTVTGCPNKEARGLTDSFKDRDKAAAIDTFAAALTSDDEKIRTVAANLSSRALGALKPGAKVERSAALRLIEAVGKSPKYHAAQSVSSAVHAATLAGTTDELYAMLDGHSYTPVASIAYKDLMTHGRIAVLPKLKELAKSGDAKVASAALAAPRRMYEATAEEKAAVCPWIESYLGDADKKKYTAAGHTAVWCGGGSVDALLTEGEKRLAANDFDRDSYLVFRDICFTPFGNKFAGTEEQCERNYKLLEAATNNDKLTGSARGLALFAIYYQRRDAKTMKLMKKYKNSKVAEIKKYANDAIDSLRTTYKIK